jgi:hypothetical protein
VHTPDGVIMSTGSVLSSQTTKDLIRAKDTAVRALESAQPKNIKSLADAERAHITPILGETDWIVGGPRGAAPNLECHGQRYSLRCSGLGFRASRREAGQCSRSDDSRSQWTALPDIRRKRLLACKWAVRWRPEIDGSDSKRRQRMLRAVSRR